MLFRCTQSVLIAGIFVSHIGLCGAQAVSAGNLSGEGTVSRSGAFTYKVPIALPAGVDGLQPELWLQYDSQAASGLLGRSFTLAGLPSVTRCGKTKRQDGDSKAPNLTPSDRFCYEGARLVLDESGTAIYGADGALYRTEFDQFARVKSGGNAGGGPLTFVVNTKSGLQHTFGGSADSRHMLAAVPPSTTPPSAVLGWSISETKDFIGNIIGYKYTSGPNDGSQYIERVTYNGGQAYVAFEYETDGMPARRYVGGGLLTRGSLLKAIRVYVRDDSNVERLVRVYSFAYTYGDVKGDAWGESVAMLKTVTQCGANGTDCLAPLTFNWAVTRKADAGFANAETLIPPGSYSGAFTTSGGWITDVANPRRFADMNRDGVLDIVGVGNDGVYVAQSISTFGTATPTVSMNGPSKARDQFGFQQFGWGGQATLTINPKYVIDMNRDGYPDVVGISDWFYWDTGAVNYERGFWISYWNKTTSSFDPKVRIASGDFYTAQGVQDFWGDNYAYGSDFHAPRYLVDMNKDGYPDVVGFDERGVWVSFFDGNSLSGGASGGPAKLVSGEIKMRVGDSGSDWSLTTWLSSDNSGTDFKPIFVEDMNADGYPDIVAVGVGGTFILYWMPDTQTFGPATLVTSDFRGARRNERVYPVQLMDMNGDSLPDLVQFGGEGVRVSLWTGTKFSPLEVWTSEFRVDSGTDLSRRPWRLADVDGDGFPDLVSFADEGVRVALSNGSNRLLPSRVWTTDIRSAPGGLAGIISAAQGGNNFDIALKTPRHIVDLDGDGAVDIVGFSASAVVWARQKSNPGPRITQVQDSNGAKLSVRYSVAQNRSGFYMDTFTPSSWPIRDGAGSTVVTAQITKDGGAELTTRITTYLYEGRKFHYDDGPLGFARIEEQDALTGLRVSRTFDQTFPFIGALTSEEIFTGGSRLFVIASGTCLVLTEICFTTPPDQRVYVNPRPPAPPKVTLARKTWTPKAEELGLALESPVGFKRLFSYTERLVEEAWELDGTALPTKTTVDLYAEPSLTPGAKQWGNRTQRTVTLSTGESTKTTDAFETADETAWKVGRLKKRVVEAQRPGKTVPVSAPVDAAPPPQNAGPLPLSPAVLGAILQLLLED